MSKNIAKMSKNDTKLSKTVLKSKNIKISKT